MSGDMRAAIRAVGQTPRPATKTCPQCGQELFADMDVCYGCLYDFSRGQGRVELLPADVMAPQDDVAVRETLLDLDEPEGMAAAVVVPPVMGTGTRTPQVASAAPPQVLVQTADMDVRLPLDEEGFTVGRMPANDVVLHSRAVSRFHARFSLQDGRPVVEDLGATNTIVVRGSEAPGKSTLAQGDVVDVCGARFTIVGGGVGLRETHLT